jgi:transaldolase
MSATQQLHDFGQSLWLDNITRTMLDNGQIQRYIDTYSVTGLTSNPSIFDAAIATGAYDESISTLAKKGMSSEDIFFAIAIADLQRAAGLFAPVHERTNGVDGWVSLEVSPLFAYDTKKTVETAKWIHAQVDRPNLFVKIPGTPEGLPAIEECIASGVPINVTLLFDVNHYRACVDAYLRGIERRIEAGLNPAVGSVASIFISRWDASAAKSLPAPLQNQLGLTVGLETYRAYRDVMESDRFQRLANSGARMQRLLWASTKTKDPAATDTLYIHGLASPFTVNTMPDSTLEAFFDHGEVGDPLPRDGGDYVAKLKRFADAGIDVEALGQKLQSEGAQSFVDSWTELIQRIDAVQTSKS